jgi:hypothetical protein
MWYRQSVTGALLVLALAGAASGGEFSVHPSIGVTEEYTDNVFETEHGRVSEFTTRAMPGISLAYKAPALEADVNYIFDYRYYARRTRGTETTHALAANGRLTAVENLLFVELSDIYQRVSLDVTRDVTVESLFLNQSDRNVASVSPYIVLTSGKVSQVKAGYRFTDTRYREAVAIDKTNHMAYLDASYEFSPRWYATCGYSFTREDAQTSDYDQHQGYAGFRYEYGNKSFLFGQGGYTRISFSNSRNLSNVYWHAGALHSFTTVTASVNTGVKYDEDPLHNIIQNTYVTGNLEKQLPSGTLGLSLTYSEYTQSESDVLQTRKYGGVVSGKYEFTSQLNGNLSFAAEKYEQKFFDSYTRRFVVDTGLSYLLAKQLSLALTYIFVDYYSPGIATDNKRVNRAMLAISKTF